MAVTLISGPDPVSGTNGAAWEVCFGDTQRPAWVVTLTMTAVGTEGFHCTGVEFKATHGTEGEELPPKWVSRFPLARCLREARLAAAEVLVEGRSLEALSASGLPYGFPNRANRRTWYPAFMACVEAWERAGMSRMDIYREVAARKRRNTNNVKQWVHQAKKLAEEASQ